MDDIMANPDAIGATFLRMADIPSSISLRHEEERLGLAFEKQTISNSK